MIKNYRLYTLKSFGEVSLAQRELFLKNKGTSILVNNSLIIPENFIFTTILHPEYPEIT